MHTPGPWKINEHTPCVSAVTQSETDLLVAVCHPYGYSSQANARLIAAAPDLLEACRVLCGGGGGGGGLSSARHQQGMAAIAKAIGYDPEIPVSSKTL